MIDDEARNEVLAEARKRLVAEKGASLGVCGTSASEKPDACADPAARIKELFARLDVRLERMVELLNEVCDAKAAADGGEKDDTDLVWIHKQIQVEMLAGIHEIEEIVIEESFACGPRNATPVPWETSMEAEEALRRKFQTARNSALQDYRARQNVEDAKKPTAEKETPVPWQIKESLNQFSAEHPNPERNFLITGISGMGAVQAVRSTLTKNGKAGFHAADRKYHEDEHWNLVTYLRGCGACIAIYENIEEASPPVALSSFAAGYMEALGGRVCRIAAKGRGVAGIEAIGGADIVCEQENLYEAIPEKLELWLKAE